MLRRGCLFLALVCLPIAAAAQDLTLERVFSADGLAGPQPEQLQWSPDGASLSYILEGAGGERNLWVADAQSGGPRVLVSHAQLAALAPALDDATDDERERERRRRYAVASYLWAPDSRSLLFTRAGSLYLYEIENNRARELTPGLEGVRDPRFSPDGKFVSFVYEHDLWLADLADRRLRRLTTGGSADLLHGDLDWVYPEEFGVRRGHLWSPDSRRIAFLETDQSRVPQYPLTTLTTARASVDLQRYPQAGDPNPQVRVGVLEIGDPRSAVTWFDSGDEYLPRFCWTPENRLIVQSLDRSQKNLRVESIDMSTGARTALLSETDAHWINIHDDFRFLEGGGEFLWSSERSGFRHLYLYRSDGTLVRQLTEGNWEVAALAGVDQEAGVVYFTANRDNPIGADLYAVRLTGGDVRRVTSGLGVHRVSMNPGATAYADARSTLRAPETLAIGTPGGDPERIIHQPNAVNRSGWAEPELNIIETEDGAEIRTLLLKPPRLERGKKYPLVIYVYGGPHAPTIRDAWDTRGRYQFHQRLAQQGFVVAYVDDRASSRLGHKYEIAAARNYGPTALADQLVAVEAFKRLPFVDPERIGIWGWSGGGFATCFAMTRSDAFRAGIAVAPVTDWRFYDSIYTERYMGLPGEEPEAYRRASPLEQADRLQGRLMLMHGTSDDNVHPQNTIAMIDALIEAGKSYDLQLYPGQTHGISSPQDRLHAFRMMELFWIRELRDVIPSK